MPSKFEYDTVLTLELDGCSEGVVLDPLTPLSDEEKRYFAGWDTPLAPRGAFGLNSGLEIVRDGERTVLEIGEERAERALVSELDAFRDGRIVAEIKPIETVYGPHVDRDDCREALVGVVFRVQTSRAYYQFGIEGRRRAVLYRRNDDEWFVMAEQPVDLLDEYVTLVVTLEGDGIHCRCDGLGVHFLCTDTTFQRGRVGVRSLGRARIARVEVAQTKSQQERDEQWRVHVLSEEKLRAADVPDATLVRTFDLQELGGRPIFYDFAVPGRFDMLIPRGNSLRAMTTDGQLLWEAELGVHEQIVFSKEHGSHGRLIYAFTGVREVNQRPGILGDTLTQSVADEMVVIRGSDGKVTARATIPPLEGRMRFLDYSTTSGNLTDTGGFDIVLREWRQDKEGGGVNLWAYDRDLHLLWHYKLNGAYYGHHYAVQFYDIDNDGYDELLAGGTMLDRRGNVIWIHDRDREMQRMSGAHHYDAVALGALAQDADSDPVAFLLGGSAGVYVVDALTGRTRAIHRVGHAQGRFVGKVRADLPGEQVLVATRWGNYGILTLLSGRGERLWTIQPDYIGQGSRPVSWGNAEAQLIWMNTSGPVHSLYDGWGRRLRPLPELCRLHGDRQRKDVVTDVIRMGNEPTEYLCIMLDEKLYVFGPQF